MVANRCNMATKEIDIGTNEAVLNAIALAVGAAIKAALPADSAIAWKTPLKSGSFDLTKLHAHVLGAGFVHGFLVRLIRATALGKTHNKKLGRIPTMLDKVTSLEKLITHYESGSEFWDQSRAGFIRTDETLEFLVRALTGYVTSAGVTWDADEARKFLKTKTAAERSQIATDQKLRTWSFVKAQMGKDAQGPKGSIDGL